MIKAYFFAVFALIGGLVIGCQSPAQPISITKASTAKPAASSTPEDNAPRITLADAKAAFDADNAIFVDTRAADAYKQEHIKGAISIPGGTLDANLSKLSKGKKIIAYCSWPHEHTSASLVSDLNRKGFDNAFALVGGTQGWKSAGYPMEKGE